MSIRNDQARLTVLLNLVSERGYGLSEDITSRRLGRNHVIEFLRENVEDVVLANQHLDLGAKLLVFKIFR
jgi:hypothetical protein